MKNIVFSNDDTKPLEIDICAISDWRGFDKLIEFIIKEYGANIIENIDGPDARVCKLSVENEEFELRYEHPYGNHLYALNIGEDRIVKQIGLDLAKRLNNL